MKLGDVEFIYSGWKDWVHRQGVGLMINKEAAKSCLGCRSIHNTILIAHFMPKRLRVSVIVVYAPVESTDGDTSDKKCLTCSICQWSQIDSATLDDTESCYFPVLAVLNS